MLDILVNVDDMRDDNPAVRVGLDVASRHNGFATGLHVVDVFPSALALPDAVEMLAMEEREARARDAWWGELCRKRGVRGAWEVIRGIYVPLLARRSCMADITVSHLPDQKDPYPASLNYVTRVLLASSSPMLLVPSAWDKDFRATKILVAWNNTPESMRALRAALPFLREAEMVYFVDGTDEGVAGFSPPPLPVRDWLTRQGVTLHAVQQFPANNQVGDALLDKVHGVHADLLVMGAWGHSRITELLLGGTTRHVLENAALPVLLAH